MQKNNKRSTVNNIKIRTHNQNQHQQWKHNQITVTNQDLSMITNLSAILQTINLTCTLSAKSKYKQQMTSNIKQRSEQSRSKKVSASQLMKQFGNRQNQRDKHQIQTVHKNRVKKEVSKTNKEKQSFAESPYQLYIKRSQQVNIKSQNQNSSKYSTFKQQQEIRSSTMTFSPLRVDISLPSLCSEQLDQLKQQRQMISQIEKDIKKLINKIKVSHSNDSPNKGKKGFNKSENFTKKTKK